MTDNPLLSAHRQIEDVDAALRPKMLDEFVGQAAAKDNLRVFIESAKSRKEALDHTLFFGPPGLGKTTLAQIIARELGVNFRATSGPVIAKSGDLAALLQRACAAGDSAMVARANGVGPKLAARIVNELKDKAGGMPSSPLSAGTTTNTPPPAGKAAADVISALQNLGFKPQTAEQATQAALAELGEEAPVPALIRVALKKVTA